MLIQNGNKQLVFKVIYGLYNEDIIFLRAYYRQNM